MSHVWSTALLLLTACGSAPPAPAPPPLRILAYNIHHGAGVDGRLDLGRIATVIHNSRADLVALQEVDRGTERTLRVDQARRLGELLGMDHVFGAFMDYQGGEYGMAILSRLPILDHENIRLPPGPEPRTTLTARVQVPGGPRVVLASIHFYRTEDERRAQAAATTAALADEADPVVLAGDFNSRRGGPVLTAIGAAFTEVRKTDPADTFPSPAPDREIDHFFVRAAGRLRPLGARVLGERVASDHRPILLEVLVR